MHDNNKLGGQINTPTVVATTSTTSHICTVRTGFGSTRSTLAQNVAEIVTLIHTMNGSGWTHAGMRFTTTAPPL